MIRFLLGMLIVIIICLPLSILTSNSQHTITMTVTSTIMPIGLTTDFYTHENCEAICFFGLIVGESTTEDVIQMLEQQEDTFLWRICDGDNSFDDETGYLFEGQYCLYWQNGLGFEYTDENPSKLYIENGVLTYIELHSFRNLTLGETLLVFPQPDQIYAIGILDKLYFDFVYDTRLVVSHVAYLNNCDIPTLRQDFYIDQLRYASANAYSASEYQNLGIPVVPFALWEEWLQDLPDISCQEALYELYTLLPTSTPTPMLLSTLEFQLTQLPSATATP